MISNKLCMSATRLHIQVKRECVSWLCAHAPSGIAAAVICVSIRVKGEFLTQGELARTAGVTEVTRRNRYKEFIQKLYIELKLKFEEREQRFNFNKMKVPKGALVDLGSCMHYLCFLGTCKWFHITGVPSVYTVRVALILLSRPPPEFDGIRHVIYRDDIGEVEDVLFAFRNQVRWQDVLWHLIVLEKVSLVLELVE